MTKRRTLLADATELHNVLRALGLWEAAGGDLTSAHDRRCFVDGLDNDAADELHSRALTNVARLVLGAKTEPEMTYTSPAALEPARVPRQGDRQWATFPTLPAASPSSRPESYVYA